MKRKNIVVIIIGIFLLSFASANLILNFGKIIGEVEVRGPVFYAGGDLIGENPEKYILSLSDFVDGDESYVSFENGGENVWFVSEELGVESFYNAEYKFFINVCAKNHTINDTTGQITMSLKILDENGNFRKTVCELYINNIQTKETCNSDDYELYHVFCTEKIEGIDEEDRFAWIMTDGDHDMEYRIRTEGQTKFKIEAI